MSPTGVVDALSAATSRVDQLAGEIEHLHRLAMLGVLSAGLAHEINNILTPVIAYSHAALSADSDGRLKDKALRKALRGAESAAAIVSGTLAASQSSDNHMSTKVDEAFQRALQSLGRDPRRDGIVIDNDLPDGCRACISCVSLQQVFMNLLLNACNAMHSRRGKISITAEQRGDRVLIRFEDTGPGIPESVRDRIFQPFVTADASPHSSARSTGTGLGLAVCKLLIESAGGSISVETETDQGTCFTIELQIAAANSQREAA